MIDVNDVEPIARRLLREKGIELIGCGTVKKVDGALRKVHVPEKPDDFWLVTFRRSTALVEGGSQLNEEELEILTAAAEANDSVTVAVEKDGTAEVV